MRAFIDGGYQRLVAALTLIAGRRADAEDAVQEALARAWARGLRGERFDSPGVWVAVVARNILRSGLRSLFAERTAKIRLQRDLSELKADDSGTDGQLDVLRAMGGLPRRQREAVALHYFADLSLVEVGRVMGATEGAVKALLHRARISLGEMLRMTDPLGLGEVDGIAGR